MPEGNEEKTEEPTAKQRRKFREEGNIPQSRDIGGTLIMATILLYVVYRGDTLYQGLSRTLVSCFQAIPEATGNDASGTMLRASELAGLGFSSTFSTVAAITLGVGTAAGLAQTGANFSLKALEFKPEKFNFIKGLKRVLASAETLQQIGLAIAKASLLGASLYAVLLDAIPSLLDVPNLELPQALMLLGMLFLRLMIVGVMGAAILAAVDYWVSYRRINKQMKMGKQEVKDEHKQQEGDPLVRGRMRQRMREIGTNQMLSSASQADVVVVNPTHYAVALRYDPDKEGAPRVLAKGKDAVAGKLREIARAHGIPVIADPPVARALYASAKIGAEVPGDLYEMVARVLAYLHRMTGRIHR